MSEDQLSKVSLNDRTVYVCAVKVSDLPEKWLKGFLRIKYMHSTIAMESG